MAFISSLGAQNLVRVRKNSSLEQRCTPTASISRRDFVKLAPLPILVTLLPPPAKADHTYVAGKRSFERYHPRIVEVVERLSMIGERIAAGDMEGANAMISDKQLDIRGRRAMSIYATSFSDNYLGERSRDMLRCVEGLFKELGLVAGGTEVKMHYGKAVEFMVDYYTVARLPMSEVSKLHQV